MKYYVVIPAHNEEAFLARMLDTLLAQSLLPKKVIIVNDNSTDGTEAIIDLYAQKHLILTKVNSVSSQEHLPGSKVINAFNKGVKLLDADYDFIVKLDADLLLPPHYFETIANHINEAPKVGIVGGFIYEQNTLGDWKLQHPMDKDHVRGAFKAYSQACLAAIEGLRPAMGWDTVDELLAKYNGFNVLTDPSLKVKHLRPTGKSYNKKAKKLQGQAMYTMRYGFWITCIASLKMAFKNKSLSTFWNNISGYLKAKNDNLPYLVTKSEGAFIRKLRWSNIKRKITA